MKCHSCGHDVSLHTDGGRSGFTCSAGDCYCGITDIELMKAELDEIHGMGEQELEHRAIRKQQELIDERDALRDALRELYNATDSDPLEIVGYDADGHPLSAMGMARREAQRVLQTTQGRVR